MKDQIGCEENIRVTILYHLYPYVQRHDIYKRRTPAGIKCVSKRFLVAQPQLSEQTAHIPLFLQ